MCIPATQTSAGSLFLIFLKSGSSLFIARRPPQKSNRKPYLVIKFRIAKTSEDGRIDSLEDRKDYLERKYLEDCRPSR